MAAHAAHLRHKGRQSFVSSKPAWSRQPVLGHPELTERIISIIKEHDLSISFIILYYQKYIPKYSLLINII